MSGAGRGPSPLNRSGDLHLVDDDGAVVTDGTFWLGPASDEDHQVLARANGPVLDVGCGPGRHLRALVASGVEAMGIDLTPSMLEVARHYGVPVLTASVFEPLPSMGEWLTALLLDGNSGLGGDPLRLLRRLSDVLRPGGGSLPIWYPVLGRSHAASGYATPDPSDRRSLGPLSTSTTSRLSPSSPAPKSSTCGLATADGSASS